MWEGLQTAHGTQVSQSVITTLLPTEHMVHTHTLVFFSSGVESRHLFVFWGRDRTSGRSSCYPSLSPIFLVGADLDDASSHVKKPEINKFDKGYDIFKCPKSELSIQKTMRARGQVRELQLPLLLHHHRHRWGCLASSCAPHGSACAPRARKRGRDADSGRTGSFQRRGRT